MHVTIPLVSLVAIYSNGRMLVSWVPEHACIDAAITMVCSGAVEVVLSIVDHKPWTFHRNVKHRAAAPRPIRKAVLR
jgi:hypothetical protein